MPTTLTIRPSRAKGKRLAAVFVTDGKRKTVNFGAEGGSTFLEHKDPKIKADWIARHKVREDWTVPDNAGSLSRHLLWGPSTKLSENVKAFAKKFNLQVK